DAVLGGRGARDALERGPFDGGETRVDVMETRHLFKRGDQVFLRNQPALEKQLAEQRVFRALFVDRDLQGIGADVLFFLEQVSQALTGHAWAFRITDAT